MKDFFLRLLSTLTIMITSPFVLSIQFLWWLFTGHTNKTIDKFMIYVCNEFQK